MYLHIGKDILIKKDEILFIFDYENLKNNKQFNKFMEGIDKKNIIDISDNKEKSIVITGKKRVMKAYISNISSTTLSKRNTKF